ncbi:unnamed protein product [Ixodes hexagonus]
MSGRFQTPIALARRIWFAYSDILPTLQELERRYQLMGDYLDQHVSPFSAPCTFTDVAFCWLLNYQHSWNTMINRGGLELRCHSAGRLRLTTVPCHPLESPTLQLNRNVFNLLVVLWLVNNHECIDYVDINTDVAFGDLSLVFFRMVQLGCHHWRLKVVSWLETRVSPINDEFFTLALGDTFFLESLSLWGMDLAESSTDNLVRAFGFNEYLSHVSLRSVSITKRSLEIVLSKLNECRGIKTLDLDFRIECPGLLRALEDMLASNRSIEELSYEIRGPVRFPFQALAKNRSLKILRVSNQVFDEDDINALADTLRRNRRLQTLSVAICPLEKGDALWSIFAAAVGVNTGLGKLDLRRAAVTDLAAGYLAEALRSNKTLQKLDVATDKLTGKGAMWLAESLRTNTTLQELHIGRLWEPMVDLAGFFRVLQDSRVSPRVYQFYGRAQLPALIKLLRERHKVRQVRISGAQECPPMLASLLFFAVRVQKSLTRLIIALATTLESHSARHLAILFKNCETLKDVDLNVHTESAEIKTLAAGVGQSKSISRLKVRSWSFDVQSAAAFVEMLKRNTSIIHLTVFRSNEETNHLLMTLNDVFEGNYTLLDIELFENDHSRIPCSLLLPHLRLNYFRVTRAAAFFEGVFSGQRAADDFRRLALTRPLMDRLKENTESSEEEIMAGIIEMLARFGD